MQTKVRITGCSCKLHPEKDCEPNEAVLEDVAVHSVKALRSIALAHLSLFIILLIGVRLLYAKNK